MHLYVHRPDGRLTQQTGTRYGAGIIGGINGGNGQTGREGKLVSVLPFLERYNFNLLAHHEFSEGVELFVEAKWNRVNSLGNNAGPSFNQGPAAPAISASAYGSTTPSLIPRIARPLPA